MTSFAFEALDSAGKLRRGSREAASLEMVRDDLAREALTPLRITPRRQPFRMQQRSSISEAVGAELAADLARFVKSGLTIVQSLAVLETAGSNPKLARLAATLRGRVVSGEPLSVAFRSIDGQTGHLLQTLAKAGETTGRLSDILEGGAKGLKATAQLKQKMITLTVYPAFVLLMALVAMGVFAFAVLPALQPAFEGFGDKLPLQTKLILQASTAFRAGFPIGMMVLGLFVLATVLSSRLRVLLLRALERLSLTRLGGGVVRDVVFSGFAQRLSISLAAGSPLLTAYRVSIAPISVAPVRLALEGQVDFLRDGRMLSDALASIPYAPEILVRLARVGESSSDLNKLLGEAADTLSIRAQERAERFLAVLTPLLVVTIGAMIGLIVIMVFQGLLSISEVVDL